MQRPLDHAAFIDLQAQLATQCSWCRHSEFIHSSQGQGPCLFSECNCPRFFPTS